MDMAVANLFKHKVPFEMCFYPRGVVTYFSGLLASPIRFYRNYSSYDIENLRSMGVTDINELCIKCLKPFMVYIISQLVTEETEHIKRITVSVKIFGYKAKKIYSISLDNHKLCLHVLSSNSKMTIHPIEKRLFDEPFSMLINATFNFSKPVCSLIPPIKWVRHTPNKWVRYTQTVNEEEEEEEEYIIYPV